MTGWLFESKGGFASIVAGLPVSLLGTLPLEADEGRPLVCSSFFLLLLYQEEVVQPTVPTRTCYFPVAWLFSGTANPKRKVEA